MNEVPYSHELMAMHARKPAFDKPCNSCGFCCAVQPCKLSTELLGCQKGRCPALEKDGERYLCGLVMHPSRYIHTDKVWPPGFEAKTSTMLAGILRLGSGCDSEGIVGFRRKGEHER